MAPHDLFGIFSEKLSGNFPEKLFGSLNEDACRRAWGNVVSFKLSPNGWSLSRTPDCIPARNIDPGDDTGRG